MQAARRAIAERDVELLEMEETFGLVQLVKPRLPIPVVVRLHGPHFANGPALGVPADDAFRQRVRDEGVGSRKPMACRRPRADILERTRELLRAAFGRSRCYSLPGPVVPADQPLVLADCDRSRPSVHWPVRPSQGRRRGDRCVSLDSATLSQDSAVVRRCG